MPVSSYTPVPMQSVRAVAIQDPTPLPTPRPTKIPTPTPTPYPNPLDKRIEVDVSEQRLTYYEGSTVMGSFLVSTAAAGYWTPRGTFAVQAKKPSVLYRGYNPDGSISYDYPNTKWNLQIIPRYYIHGAYWHNAFGTPRSHGCVNVAYANMEGLYNWADMGTPIIIYD